MKATAYYSIGAALQAHAAEGSAAVHPSSWPRPGAAVEERRTALALHFTPRQLEVLALLCEGLPNKLICRRLNIATGTVKVHISCILRELGVASRLQAVVAARSLGLPGDPGAGTPKHGNVASSAGESVKLNRSRASTASGQVAATA